MNTAWRSKNRCRYLLQYHVIFVCKYRRSCYLQRRSLMKSRCCHEISVKKHKIVIKYMETDKDHIHYLLEAEPVISISKIINLLKSCTTYHIWKTHEEYLSKHFWKERTFWTDSYIVCSAGNMSERQLKEYITNQG